MNCIICRMRWLSGDTEVPIRHALYIVGGAGLCATDVDRVVDSLQAGYSMKDILGEAKSGDW